MRACPTCQRSTAEAEDTPYRPFCSERCRLIDLGNWLGDAYVVAPDAPPARPPTNGHPK